MVNWQEAGKTWPRPHPHAVRLLRGLVWDQHYRHSQPQCEGAMPGSFELREDMGPDRLQAVEDWLLVEGFAFRFRQKRWRVWTRPDRPSEGLRPDGIEEDENSNEYPSGATMNVSMWDMIERKFPEPGTERTLQGSSSSSPSPGKEKPSAGDRRRDRKWREYQESLAAEAAQGAKGGTPAHSPQRAGGGHHPGHTTLGDFLEVAKQAKAKPRQMHLRKSGPSSDVESAHRGRMPADQASSSSSVAPNRRDVARACERACGVPCNLRVARQRATQRNAAVEGAVGIAQGEATEWGRDIAFHASTVAAIAAGLTAAAAHEAATAQITGEVLAAAQEARLTREAIARKGAESKALEKGPCPREGKEGGGGKGPRRSDGQGPGRAGGVGSGEGSAAAGPGSRGGSCPEGGRRASCRSNGRRNGGVGGQAPPRDSPRRIPIGDPSKALRRGRLLQDGAGSGGGRLAPLPTDGGRVRGRPREVTEASGRTPPRQRPLLRRHRRGRTRPPTSPRSGWRRRRRRPHGARG